MLLQTNSYIVPREKKAEHARLLRRFRQTLLRLGCDHFEVYEQVGANWSNAESTGRYVQILRFRDRKHQLQVQAQERSDATAQGVIAEFCDLINFPYQQQQGLFAVGFYTSVLPAAPKKQLRGEYEPTAAVVDDKDDGLDPDGNPLPEEDEYATAEGDAEAGEDAGAEASGVEFIDEQGNVVGDEASESEVAEAEPALEEDAPAIAGKIEPAGETTEADEAGDEKLEDEVVTGDEIDLDLLDEDLEDHKKEGAEEGSKGRR